jgi:endonuclease YncB( thermonuclease family)
VASIVKPDFKRRRRSTRYQPRGTSEPVRPSREIPAWIVWCFVGVLFLTALHLGLSTNQREQSTSRAVHIEVVDGDTVRSNGQVFRLVGFNTPESGLNAQCSSERTLAERAIDRLQELLAEGTPNLQRVACACEPGTEGTRRCHHGRLCGRLTVDGRDVGSILISEGLAERFECWATSCPRRKDWCRS